MEAGGRVSYKPYRDVSKIFINRLRQFAEVGVIEKASIDEAYVLYKLEPQQQSYGTMTVMQQAAQLAETMRQAGDNETCLPFVVCPAYESNHSQCVSILFCRTSCISHSLCQHTQQQPWSCTSQCTAAVHGHHKQADVV